MMVKGISRQVIVVQTPDPGLFEQAIFILKDDAVSEKGVTEEMLLREANRLINAGSASKKNNHRFSYLLWASTGALATGLVWLFFAFL